MYHFKRTSFVGLTVLLCKRLSTDCGRPAKFDGKKKGYEVCPVWTFGFQEKISEICEKIGDDWANMVKGRLECCHDLFPSDAVYHQQCNVNFRTNKGTPKTLLYDDQVSAKKKRGRTY